MDVGIDLGTTFSVIAVDGKVELSPNYPGGQGLYLEDCQVTVVPSPQGEITFPSVMMPDPESPGNWLFGSEALQMAEEGEAPVMFSKRKIGTLEEIPVATGAVTAKDVAARFLAYLKRCAEEALGVPVRRAVVTHPAYFDRCAVEETRDSARQAGFDMSLPQQMLMEPTAAALAYTRADPRDPLRILTYDLGGGTFDVTYMERIGGVIQVRSFDGNHLLGGYNFDKELVRLLRARLAQKGRNLVFDEDKPEDRGRLARLLRIAENVKIELSRTKSDGDTVEFRVRNFLVDDKGLPVQANERISRREFVESIRPWLDEVLECCRRALANGKARPEDLHQILLVGGSSYGPWVMDSLREEFPGVEMKLFNPDLCVGAGAAIHASMALPHEERVGAYRIELETPETSALDFVHVTGRFVRIESGLPPEAGMTVALKPQGRPGELEAPLDADGRFLFKEVELTEEGTNAFSLRLMDGRGQRIVEHPFAIERLGSHGQQGEHRGSTSIVTGSTTVLPRPLYIETVRGLVALAQEGVALPAKCVATFERTNSNPNIILKLFQEQDPVGLVRIENIPDDAGTGSPVELTIEVTADNQVRGEVVIYRLVRVNGGETRRAEALRSPILVSFDPTAIPTRQELLEQFEELKGRGLMLPLIDPYLAKAVEATFSPLVARIEQGFEHQPFERQELYVAIRRLHNLVIPPKDDMMPIRRDFLALAGQCRTDIEEQLAAREAIRSEFQRTGAQELEVDGRKMDARRVAAFIKRLGELEERLEELEREGLDSYERKDRVAWPKTFERLGSLQAEVEKLKPPKRVPDITKLPTPLLKVIVIDQEINGRVKLIQQHAQVLSTKGELADWMGELQAIMELLAAAHSSVFQISDDTPSPQALAQIMKTLEQVRGLDARILAIGRSLA